MCVQGINLKGCLYFIGKGNLKFSFLKMKGYLKNCPSSLMVRLLYKRYFFSYIAISMAQSIIRDRLLFFSVHFEGFTKNYPFLLEGLQSILKECEGLDPKIKVIALQFYSLVCCVCGSSWNIWETSSGKHPPAPLPSHLLMTEMDLSASSLFMARYCPPNS